MKRLRKISTALAFRIIGGILCLLLVYNFVVQTIGYRQFNESLTKEYNDYAFRTAETALTLFDGGKIDEYLASGGSSEDYRRSSEMLDILCQKQNVTLIYVICVDTSDYGSFTSVFNACNEQSPYEPWPAGYRRETTNDEYARIYRDIYENGLQQGTVVRTAGLRGYEPHITSLVPVTDENGAVTAILCVQRPMDELAAGSRNYMLDVGMASLILSIIACLSAAGFLKNQFVRPVDTIIGEARRFATENSAADGTTMQDISNIQEIRDLAASVEKMESDTLQYMEHLVRATAERERMDTELALAHKLQSNMLPNKFPAFPERNEFDIHAVMLPAKEVGGDFYDFYLLDDDHLGITIADVSGKGVPAALFMMMTKVLLKNLASMGGGPAELLRQLNSTLSKNNKDDMFVTVWFAIYTISTGKVVAANAGHEYPFVRHGNGSFEQLKDRHGFVVGGMPGMKYPEYEFTLGHGDVLFLYTDGLPEATDTEEKMYGCERALAALNAEPSAVPRKLIENVNADVERFVGAADRFDDLTLLALKRT